MRLHMVLVCHCATCRHSGGHCATCRHGGGGVVLQDNVPAAPGQPLPSSDPMSIQAVELTSSRPRTNGVGAFHNSQAGRRRCICATQSARQIGGGSSSRSKFTDFTQHSTWSAIASHCLLTCLAQLSEDSQQPLPSPGSAQAAPKPPLLPPPPPMPPPVMPPPPPVLPPPPCQPSVRLRSQVHSMPFSARPTSRSPSVSRNRPCS